MDNKQQDFLTALAKSVLEIDSADVDTLLDPWDSLAVMSTIVVIDDIYGKSVPGKALMDCVTAGDIIKLVEGA